MCLSTVSDRGFPGWSSQRLNPKMPTTMMGEINTTVNATAHRSHCVVIFVHGGWLLLSLTSADTERASCPEQWNHETESAVGHRQGKGTHGREGGAAEDAG